MIGNPAPDNSRERIEEGDLADPAMPNSSVVVVLGLGAAFWIVALLLIVLIG